MKSIDIDPVCSVWKQAGLSIADYDREIYELHMLMAANPDTCLVAKHNQDIVGTIIGASNGRRVWIYHLAVLPNWQGKGVGSALLSEVENSVKLHGATKLLLGVGWDNLNVIPFYTKQGFTSMMDMLILQKNLYSSAEYGMKGGENI